jgi:hypothetical protein
MWDVWDVGDDNANEIRIDQTSGPPTSHIPRPLTNRAELYLTRKQVFQLMR